MLNFDPNQVVIYALVFVLGLLVGGFLFTGGGRKWKAKYNAEVDAGRNRSAACPGREGLARTGQLACLGGRTVRGRDATTLATPIVRGRHPRGEPVLSTGGSPLPDGDVVP